MLRPLLIILLLQISFAGFTQKIETMVQRSSGGIATDLCISPDGNLLAKTVGLIPNEVEVWNARTGQLLQVIRMKNDAYMGFTTQIRFWKDGKAIIASKMTGEFEIYDVATGAFLKKLSLVSWIKGVFALHEPTGIIACVHPASLNSSAITLFDVYSNMEYDSFQFKGIHDISALEFTADGQRLIVGTGTGDIHVYDLLKKEMVSITGSHSGKINYLQCTKDNYLLASDEHMYSLRKMDDYKIVNGDSISQHTRVVTHPSEDAFFMGDGTSIMRLNEQRMPLRSFGVQPDAIEQVKVNVDGRRMYIATRNFIKVWDLQNIQQVVNTSRQEPGFKDSVSMMFIPEQRSILLTEQAKAMIQPIDTALIPTTLSFETGAIRSSMYLGNNKFIFSLPGKVKIWDNGKVSDHQTQGTQQLLFQLSANEIVSADSLLAITDITTGKRKIFHVKDNIYCGAANSNNKIIAAGGRTGLYIIDPVTMHYKELYDSLKEAQITEFRGSAAAMYIRFAYKQLAFSNDSKKLYALNVVGQLKVWDLITSKIDTIINDDVSGFTYLPTSGRLLLYSRNEITWMNASNYNIIARMAFLNKGDHIVTLSDNFYKASRHGSKAVAFRNGMNVSAFDQYDVLYNRPDIVTERLGNPSNETKLLLRKAVAKRKKRLGINDTDVMATIDPPEASIKSYSKLPAVTDDQQLNFVLEARDRKNDLTTALVFVNGVPLNKKDGMDLRELAGTTQIRSVNLNIQLLLEPGRNIIESSCINDKGIESARISFEIFYKDTRNKKPNLYFIGIAASQYADQEYNLKYPDKDVTDIAKMFSNNQSQFGSVRTMLLRNEAVTKERISALKEMLDSTNVNDYVVIHWSGHGVLNKELDYYLATFDMNFDAPEKRGMNYNDLENLLDNIPARKRLLFIDACHSGEVDKDETKFVRINAADTSTANVQTKGLNLRKTKVTSAADILNELFADVRRQSGANIISAAGGSEFALEGDNWGYGVFSYALLQGLKEGKADLNNDGMIYISELQSYLQQTVQHLTGGRQKPTSRTENLVSDWRIW